MGASSDWEAFPHVYLHGMKKLDGAMATLSILTEPGGIPKETPVFDDDSELTLSLLNNLSRYNAKVSLWVRGNKLLMDDASITIGSPTVAHGIVLHTKDMLVSQFSLDPPEHLSEGVVLNISTSSEGVLQWS